MLKRAFNVVKKDVGKIMFALRANVLLGENEPLLRTVLVQDVFVNVALRVAFRHMWGRGRRWGTSAVSNARWTHCRLS